MVSALLLFGPMKRTRLLSSMVNAVSTIPKGLSNEVGVEVVAAMEYVSTDKPCNGRKNSLKNAFFEIFRDGFTYQNKKAQGHGKTLKCRPACSVYDRLLLQRCVHRHRSHNCSSSVHPCT